METEDTQQEWPVSPNSSCHIVLIGAVGRKLGWLSVVKDTSSSSPSPCGAGAGRLRASPCCTGLAGNDQSPQRSHLLQKPQVYPHACISLTEWDGGGSPPLGFPAHVPKHFQGLESSIEECVGLLLCPPFHQLQYPRPTLLWSSSVTSWSQRDRGSDWVSSQADLSVGS